MFGILKYQKKKAANSSILSLPSFTSIKLSCAENISSAQACEKRGGWESKRKETHSHWFLSLHAVLLSNRHAVSYFSSLEFYLDEQWYLGTKVFTKKPVENITLKMKYFY